MAQSLVVHCKRARYDIYIGRGSKWGNPFKIGIHGTREQVIDRYEQWLRDQPHLIAALGELTGKTLGCWCAPQRCHGDVLTRLAARVHLPAPGEQLHHWPAGAGPRCRSDPARPLAGP